MAIAKLFKARLAILCLMFFFALSLDECKSLLLTFYLNMLYYYYTSVVHHPDMLLFDFDKQVAKLEME